MEITSFILYLIWIFIMKNQCLFARYMEHHGDDLPPCKDPHTSIVLPFISDIDGQFISDPNDYFSDRLLSESYYLYPDKLTISFNWNNKTLTLLLNKNILYGEDSFTEWTEGNVTYSEQTDEKCYYQGYVKDQIRSFVAVSLCQGVSGYIKKDGEELIIQPKEQMERFSNKPLTHKVIGCIDLSGPVLQANNSTRHRRQAPSSRKKYLEVMIAADTSVAKLVGEKKVKQYIMTIMNIVNMVYKDETLGIDIEVLTSKIVLLDKKAERSVVASRDARRTVDKFCRWVSLESYKNQYFGSGTRFDVAVFFTRTGLGPAGYAPITGLCNPSRSCAVVKDEGFTSAFIVAHEIAHVFGLMHDGHGNNCNGQKYQTAVMAAMVQATLNHFWWSSCSRKRMKQVLPHLTCLDNNPLKTEEVSISEPLGVNWGIDEQCRYEFGADHEACRAYHGDLCEMLWCSTKRNPRLCKTKRGSPLNGTSCGTDRWCMEGSCQYHGGEPPRDGGFSAWSEWGKCAEDCGFSIKTRSRNCDNPRQAYGGRPCEGPHQEVDSCISKVCTQYIDKREQQCSVLNVLPVRDRRNTWLPYQLDNESKYCKLTCVSNETAEIATFDDIPVEDGTPCNYDNPNHICVNGECWKVGCDGLRNSTKRFDACGVCDGDGSACKTVAGRFTKKLKYNGRNRNYEEVTVIPAGARDIEIKETVTSAHFIALLDPAYGTYIFGGNGQQANSKKFAANGAWFKYVNNWNFETLKSKGPLQRKLNLMICPQNSVYKAALSYKYTVTTDDNTHEKELYEWRYKGWTDCSVTCGSGVQSLIYICFDKNTDGETENDNCRLLDDPTGDPVKCTRVECNADQYRWVMSSDLSECTHTCGTEGVQYQLYSCERETQNGDVEPVDMEMCSSLETPKYTTECNRISCLELEYRWVMSSEWSDCSTTCGEGFQFQKYSCGQDTSNGAIEVVDINLCNHLQTPNASRNCDQELCDEYQWIMTDDWSPCSENCGENGVEIQMFYCGKRDYVGDISSIGFDMCFGIEAPNITRPCNRVPCIKYQWVMSDKWSECTSSCGEHGVQYPMYECIPNISDNLTESVSAEFCSDYDHPNVSRECNRIPCFRLKIDASSNWTECSSTCGDDGIQQQLFNCVNETLNGQSHFTDISFCSGLQIPNMTRLCNTKPCDNFIWSPSNEWDVCSTTCGTEGIQFLIHDCNVVMLNGESEIVSEDYCNATEKPVVSKECNREPCLLEWKAGGWSECSVTCGIGVQTREVSCGDPYDFSDDDRCPGDPPSLSAVCKRKDCPLRSDACRDRISICHRSATPRKCQYRGYKSMCCATCRGLHDRAIRDSWYK